MDNKKLNHTEEEPEQIIADFTTKSNDIILIRSNNHKDIFILLQRILRSFKIFIVIKIITFLI